MENIMRNMQNSMGRSLYHTFFIAEHLSHAMHCVIYSRSSNCILCKRVNSQPFTDVSGLDGPLRTVQQCVFCPYCVSGI